MDPQVELLKCFQRFARIETVDDLQCIRQHSRKGSQCDHTDRAGLCEEQKLQSNATNGIKTDEGQIAK